MRGVGYSLRVELTHRLALCSIAPLAVTLFADKLPSLSLPPLECFFGTSPIQAEKLRPDRKAFGLATLPTRAVASTGPTPGISSSRLLVSFDRCQAMICRSKPRI